MKELLRRLRTAAGWALWLGAACGAGASAAAALLLLLAPASNRLDAFTHFTPLVLGAALLSFVVAWLMKLRGVVLVLAAAAALAAFLPMAPELGMAAVQAAAPRPPPSAPRLKLMTMNVWGSNQDIGAAEALIRREAPDVLVLQEADDQWRRLIENIADDYAHMAYCTRRYWCNTIILSRFDFVEDITPPVYALAAARMRLPDRLGGGVLDVIGVHAFWPWPAGRQQDDFEELVRLARRVNPESALIAGDFNSTPWSNSLHRLDRALPFPRRTRALFSWPSPSRRFPRGLRAPLALMPIDHVYAGTNWRLVELRRGPNIGSDHYPVIAVFAPKTMPPPALRGFSPADGAARP